MLTEKLQVLNDALQALGTETTWKHFRDAMDQLNLEGRKIIIRKLQRDGYIDVVREKKVVADNVYNDTDLLQRNFDGDLFILQGGYVQQRKDVESEKTKLADLEQRQFEQETRMVTLTRWVAIGAVGLVAWEIFKFFVFENHLG